jgi:hypothetical protein
MNLFIDIDGVLLGKNPDTKEQCLANDLEFFLSFCLARFDCYWLTTHCKGDIEPALNYLTPYADQSQMALLTQIKASSFKTFKTEALFGDFIWIDDQPTAYELQFLDDNDLLDRWFEVNTRQDMNGLTKLLPLLQERLARAV